MAEQPASRTVPGKSVVRREWKFSKLPVGTWLWLLIGVIQVLDEDDFVSCLVVDQLVHSARSEQHAVASGAHALLVAL
jgi:hypothetical protein